MRPGTDASTRAIVCRPPLLRIVLDLFPSALPLPSSLDGKEGRMAKDCQTRPKEGSDRLPSSLAPDRPERAGRGGSASPGGRQSPDVPRHRILEASPQLAIVSASACDAGAALTGARGSDRVPIRG